MKAPKIEITGTTASGKSSIAFLIQEALESKGFQCKIIDCDNSDSLKVQLTLLQRLKTLTNLFKQVENKEDKIINIQINHIDKDGININSELYHERLAIDIEKYRKNENRTWS